MALRQKVPVNDLGRGWAAHDPDVRDAVLRVLQSGRYVHGPSHAAFEAELAAFVGTAHAIGVASGTDALVLALQAVGSGSNGEAVVAANAGGYASTAAAQAGWRVVYADVDPQTLLLQPETVEIALGPRTRAVVVTHLFGNVADIAGIAAICRQRGVAVIEDCAQAIGATDGQSRVGSLGDIGTFSFYPTKNLGGVGDGGALSTESRAFADVLRRLRQYGWSSRYRITDRGGRNSRLDELQAAILSIGLRRVDELNERRNRIVATYRAAADAGGWIRMVTGGGCRSVAHLAVARTPARDELVRRLDRAGIGWDVHYPVPDHRQPALPAPARRTSLTQTELAADEIITLPCFPELSRDEVARVADVLAGAL